MTCSSFPCKPSELDSCWLWCWLYSSSKEGSFCWLTCSSFPCTSSELDSCWLCSWCCSSCCSCWSSCSCCSFCWFSCWGWCCCWSCSWFSCGLFSSCAWLCSEDCWFCCRWLNSCSRDDCSCCCSRSSWVSCSPSWGLSRSVMNEFTFEFISSIKSIIPSSSLSCFIRSSSTMASASCSRNMRPPSLNSPLLSSSVWKSVSAFIHSKPSSFWLSS